MNVPTGNAPSQRDKGERFARRHVDPGILVLPNPWDAGSAIMMVEAGFEALATTSAGIAFAMGLPDGERVSGERMLDAVAAIAAAVPVPVTADLEAGYGPRPEDVARTVRAAIDRGLVGCNIEDGTSDRNAPLLDLGLACDRIRAGADAARGSRMPFVLNARTDPFLHRPGHPENHAEAVKRANAYRAAGADCLYVPGSLDAATIGALVREIDGPLNVLGARGGAPSALDVGALERLGVKRVTIGGSLSLAALGFVRETMRRLREHGTFDYALGAPNHVQMNTIMEKYAR
jgi:2-methylisocitrate lyase-like PEP mutase family enzyme